jgi:hypothetical protein
MRQKPSTDLQPPSATYEVFRLSCDIPACVNPNWTTTDLRKLFTSRPRRAPSGKHSSSPSFETASAAPAVQAAFSSGATVLAKWISSWTPADASNCFEAKWTELSDLGDTVNLDFVRKVIGKPRVTGGGVVSRTPNGFPLPNGFRALPVNELV